ncbi:cysteine desulfurase family protein [Aquirufa sp. ROCK-SH2]
MNFPLYFDYAATTPVHPNVLDTLLPYLKDNFGNSGSSHHIYGWKSAEAVETARKSLSSYFNLPPSSLIFTSGATESNNLAIQGFLSHLPHGHLITSQIEHKAVLDVFKQLEKKGWEVTYLAPNQNGEIIPQDVQNAIRPNTQLISLMWVNNEIGSILDLSKVVQIAKNHQIAFHSDMTQGLGKLELDTHSLPDLMSFSGHKLYAPKGIGGLIISNNRIKLNPIVFGGNQERGLRAGTLATHLIVALEAAFRLFPEMIAQNKQFELWNKKMIQKLQTTLGDRILINSSAQNSLPQIINFSVLGVDWEELFRMTSKLALSNGSACNVKSQLPSHVLKALGRTNEVALSSIRFSFGMFTTEEEIDFAMEYLIEQMNKL